MNKIRGEVSVTLAGEEYTMRPTFDAMCKIEADLGEKLIPLVRRFYNGSVGPRDVAVVLAHGISAAGDNKMTVGKIGDILMVDGMTQHFTVIGDFLGAPFGHGDAEGSEGNGTAPTSPADPT